MKYLIVGLGNPGNEYTNTRHNIGFTVLDHLASKFEVTFDIVRLAYKAEIKYKSRTLYLIKPTTYMNLSGKAVNYWLNELKIAQESLLVIVDDIALPHGTLRMKPKGSSGGHNGLSSIEEVLGSSVYSRLRFGIGNDFPKGKQADYVLSNFSEEQTESLSLAIEKASEMTLSFASIGVEQTMNRYNQ